MRRFTLITIIVLFVLLGAAAIYQLVLANRNDERFPGPVPGTPLPSPSPTS
ncbi:MAG: hypothetical protein WD965_05450 [Actinomycetota bacterium]